MSVRGDEVPLALRRYAEALRRLDPLQHRIKYCREQWLKHMPHNDTLRSMLQQFPREISRGDLGELANQAKKHPTVTSAHELFVGTMLWGYGPVGYGPYRVSKMLRSSDSNRVLLRALEKILAGDIRAAYSEFQLQMCGSAFFTKHFYFAGLAAGHHPRPLIFDSVVANALESWLHVDISRLAKVARSASGRVTAVSRWPEGYECYLRTMGAWAGELGCRPDSVELFLFQGGWRDAA